MGGTQTRRTDRTRALAPTQRKSLLLQQSQSRDRCLDAKAAPTRARQGRQPPTRRTRRCPASKSLRSSTCFRPRSGRAPAADLSRLRFRHEPPGLRVARPTRTHGFCRTRPWPRWLAGAVNPGCPGGGHDHTENPGPSSAINLAKSYRLGAKNAAHQGCLPAAPRTTKIAERRAISSAGERSLHTGEVAGSIPASPTTRGARALYCRWDSRPV
jgi:hypothetical protein